MSKPKTETYVPVRTLKSKYAVDGNGTVTVETPARLFREARRVPLDKAGSFLWLRIDGTRSVEDLIAEFQKEFPKTKDPKPKVLRFLSNLRRDGLIEYH